MELYSILALFFMIGAVGIFMINRKSSQVEENSNRWKKYGVYLLLVFGQLFLIGNGAYACFGMLLLAVGFYEIIKIGRTARVISIGLFCYGLIGWFFFSFLTEAVVWLPFLFVVVITFDGYAQLAGQLFGSVVLFPVISPNKTLEGLFGGMVAVVITSIILSQALHLPLYQAMAFGLMIAILAVLGDFLASLYKRKNGAKDYSRLIPNHGGVLDRFDSLILAGAGFGLLLKTVAAHPLVLTFIIYILLFLLLFLVAEMLYHSWQCRVEVSRKWVHFASGIICLSFPFYLNDHWAILVLCLGFILLLAVSQKQGLLQSVNNIGRKSYGSLLFPVAVYCCFLMYQYHDHQQVYFYLPILVLAICDPLAALAGKKYPYGKYKSGTDHKTIVGSLAFFGTCFIIVGAAFYTTDIRIGALLLASFVVATTTTLAEALSRNGADNLFIPLTVLLVLHAL